MKKIFVMLLHYYKKSQIEQGFIICVLKYSDCKAGGKKLKASCLQSNPN